MALSQENEDQWSRRLISLLDFGEVWEAAEPEIRLNTQTPKSKPVPSLSAAAAMTLTEDELLTNWLPHPSS